MSFFSRKKLPSQPNSAAKLTFEESAGLVVKSAHVVGESSQQSLEILHDITVTLKHSKTAVLGLNGSGKSTFLKLFNGLIDCSSGTVQVHGVDVDQNITAIRRRVGLLFSDPQSQLIMPTPVEDVELSLHHENLEPGERRRRAVELLTQRGLGERAEHSVFQLSGGERQLTALVAVLAVEPRVLLLDEPTTLLDLRNKLRFTELLHSLPQQMVISTHDLELAEECDQAMIIHEGRLLAQGSAQQIVEDYRSYCAQGFPPSTEQEIEQIRDE